MQIQVAVASHKLQQMPHDSMYLPIFVGHFKHPDAAPLPPRWQPDDQPENQQISAKNPHYCELTATYWMWKNSQADAKGLVHYRRLLSLNKSKDLDTMLTNSETAKLLSEYDLILPKKRNYYVETLWSHYVHSHHPEPLEILKDVIHNKYPDYADAFDRVMQRKSAHMFNILIAKAPIFDEFCSWMFDVLKNVEHDERLNLSDYSDYEARVFGFLSEFLLDVWLEMHPQYHYTEVNCIFTEKQNWLKKGGTFLIRKFIPGFNSK